MIGALIFLSAIVGSTEALSPVTVELHSHRYAMSVDTKTDTSITRYVGRESPLQLLQYKPEDLIDLNEAVFAHVQGGIGSVRREAFYQFADMAYHFRLVFGKRLVVVSSYRSFGLQEALFKAYTASHGTAAAGFSALPGHSEHQLGLAVDLFTANDVDAEGYAGYYDRLRQNAHKRGRTQSYQKGVDVDGYIVEQRHWRYLGIELASELYEKGMTFTERVKKYHGY